MNTPEAIITAHFLRDLAMAERNQRAPLHIPRHHASAAKLDAAAGLLELRDAEILAIKHSVVFTVGGMVEGRPTAEINYLQRLRHLVRCETALLDVLSCFDQDRSTITGERVEAWRNAATP